jgi:2-oxoglutarate ferredoxin oxidoreductase subunit alpha
MTTKSNNVVDVDRIVIKFAGDSGDGMQLSGTQFSDTSAVTGNDLATFPDFPSEIRAPQGTLAGVSGFQVHIGHADIHTSGDDADVLVAMNPAALKYNMHHLKPGSTIILDADLFEPKNLKKAGYETNPLEDGSLSAYTVIAAPITTMTRTILKETGLDVKTIDKSRNQFALGIVYYLLNRNIEEGINFLKQKFAKKPKLVESNAKVIKGGWNYAENQQLIHTTYRINPNLSKKGKFKNITGNVATAWGLMAAAERANLPLFLGSYPITPATDILAELSKHKNLGVKTFQAEDEIAGVISAIGASYAGSMAATTTSGPGLSLKSEALGLAVMTELPLVVVDVQRGGPSTGLPTKTEQSDLLQALWGRNGEAPMVVIAASSSSDCFDYAFIASKISLEHMVPVILLTDSYLANGSELWQIPDIDKLPEIHPPFVPDNVEGGYMPYKRDPETLARNWAVPGQEGNQHRVGGLEKLDIKGSVSHDPLNHEKMVQLRAEKVNRVVNVIPNQTFHGPSSGKLLVVGWGSTKGAIYSAWKKLHDEGKDIAMTTFNYIHPLPANTEEVLSGYDEVLVCELNNGQFVYHLRSLFPHIKFTQFNKNQAQPFMVTELVDKFNETLEGK